MGELHLPFAWRHSRAGPGGLSMGECENWSHPSTGQRYSGLWWSRCGRDGRLTNSATMQGHFQSLGLAHPNIFPIYDMLEHSKVPVLFCWSRATGSLKLRAAERYLRVSMREQYCWCSRSHRPWTKLMSLCNEHLQVELFGQFIHCVTHLNFQCHYDEWIYDGEEGKRRREWQWLKQENVTAQRGWQHVFYFVFCFFLILIFIFYFLLGGGYKCEGQM